MPAIFPEDRKRFAPVTLARKKPVPQFVIDRAGAITEQHIISDPDRDLLFVRWINRVGAGKNAGLFLRKFRSFKIAFACGLLAIFPYRRPLLFGHDEIDK